MMDQKWEQSVVSYLTRFLSRGKLEDFKKHHPKENLIEFNPPFDGVAYQCSYRCHTMVSKPLPNGRGTAKSSYADITQYWDKDGNCIGFMYGEKRYMFDKEKLPEQARDTIVQEFRDGQSRILSKVPENSELAKYLEQYSGATVSVEKRPYGNYLTYLPKDKYPNVLPQQRNKSWSLVGKEQTVVVRDFQKEM